MTGRHRLSTAVAVAVALCTVGGCVQQRACTEIGASNGVRVLAPDLVRTQELEVEVCVDAQCGTAPLFADGPPETFVDLDAVNTLEELTYRLTVRLPGAGPVVVPTQEVITGANRVQPNGEGCPPTVYQAFVDVRV